MNAAFWQSIAGLATAIAGLITWYVHTHGSSHNGGRGTKP